MSKPVGRCYQCDVNVGGENYCPKCRTHICDECAVTRWIGEPHDADQHLLAPEGDEG